MGLDLGCRLGRRLDNRDDPKGVLTVVDVDGVKVQSSVFISNLPFVVVLFSEQDRVSEC